MTRLIYPFIALLALACSLTLKPAFADDFSDGVTSMDQGKPEQAFSSFKKAAQKGDPRAQYRLGLMYADGLGVPQDFAKEPLVP